MKEAFTDKTSGKEDISSELRGYILYGFKIILTVMLGLFLFWIASIPIFVGFRVFVDPKFSLAESYAVTSLWLMAWVIYKYGKQ